MVYHNLNELSTDELLKVYKEFSGYEEQGRKLASELYRDKPISREDLELLRDIQTSSRDMMRYFYDYKYADATGMFLWELSNIAEQSHNDILDFLSYLKTQGSYVPKRSEHHFYVDFNWLDVKAKEVFGRKCTYMYGDPDFQPYTYNRFLNDITACYHRGIEKFRDHALNYRRQGKCYFTAKSDSNLVKACKLWDKITTKMYNRKYKVPEFTALRSSGNVNVAYDEGDYSPLNCNVTDKKAELTVGSSSGHKAHVDLEDGSLHYFDSDTEPNLIVADMLRLRNKGLDCTVYDEGVRCTGVNEKNVVPVFTVLAMPTSMDYRVENCKGNLEWYSIPGICHNDCWEKEGGWGDAYNECHEKCVKSKRKQVISECRSLEMQLYNNGPAKEKL